MTAPSHSQPIDIDSLHWPVTVLGYGRRVGIWFQGCSIGCPGCCARYTWEPSGAPTNVGEVLSWVTSLPLNEIDGFTISGGEPLDQVHALRILLQELRPRDFKTQPRDVLLYSGYSRRQVERRLPELCELADLLICAPFIADRPAAYLRGSDNQGFHRLTPLATERYPDSNSPVDRRMQVALGDDGVRIIGIPVR